jgi:hypothetical protein
LQFISLRDFYFKTVDTTAAGCSDRAAARKLAA